MQRLGRIAATLSGLVVALAVAPQATSAEVALISVSPASGIPGQTVTVRGSGFCGAAGCSRVRIEVYGVTVAQNVRVSPAGRFSRRLRVPGGATGEVGFIAVQELANGAELEALANFEYLVRGVPPTAKSKATQAKPKRTSGGGGKRPDRTGPSGTPRPAPTTTTAETTPTPVRVVPPPVTTAPTETVQTSTNGNDHRRAAPPLTGDDGDDFPIAWAVLAAACIAGAVIVLFAFRTRRRQRPSPGQAR